MTGWLGRHWRITLEVALFPAMYVAAVVDEDAFTGVVALFLLLPAPLIGALNWLYLRGKMHEAESLGVDLPLLRQDFQSARTLLLISLDGALAGWSVVLRAFGLMGPVPRPVLLVLIAHALVIAVMPAASTRRWRDGIIASVNRRRRKDDPK